MGIFLLIIIYVAFISLGLPDGLLGTAWPVMRTGFKLPIEAAGLIFGISTLSTALSSFATGSVIRKFGTGKTTLISCIMTGYMLVGYSFAPSYGWLLVLTVPLGFGAGAVDTGLNHFVAKNYASSHMNWLHSFWGFGASFGPLIMAHAIARYNSWRSGYRTTGIIQLCLAVILLVSLPLWGLKNNVKKMSYPHEEGRLIKGISLIKNRAIILAVIAFPLYIGLETGLGAWLGTLLIEGRNMSQTHAGIWVSVFYLCITGGRIISGFVALKADNRTMIRWGLVLALSGALLIIVPVKGLVFPGIILTGLGCAPVYPGMMHETPKRFSGYPTESITGYQVGMAYVSGMTLIPLFGLIAGKVSLGLIPILVFLFGLLTLLSVEKLNRLT